MSENPVTPIITIRRKARIDAATIVRLRDAGYCVVVVGEHADIQGQDFVSQAALDPRAVLEVALVAMRKNYSGAYEAFCKGLADLVLKNAEKNGK